MSYQCSVCVKAFNHKSSLKRHERIHQGVRPYICSVCKKGFIDSSRLKRHERVHLDVKPYECSVCKKRFVYSFRLKSHERSHQGVRPYECSVCKKGFVNFSHLKSHERTHKSVRPYECSVCKKDFVYSSQLKRHERIHLAVRPYECSVCKKGFSYSFRLKSHERIHHDVRPNECSVWQNEFIQFSHLQSHESIHQSVRLYECSVCKKRHAYSNSLTSDEKIYQCVSCQQQIDIKTEISGHKSACAELQANNESNFSEENVIEKEEAPTESDYSLIMTYQTAELSTNCQSVEDSCSQEQHFSIGRASDGNGVSGSLVVKEEDSAIPENGERNVSESDVDGILKSPSGYLDNGGRYYRCDNSNAKDLGNDFCLNSIDQIPDNEHHDRGNIDISTKRKSVSRAILLYLEKKNNDSIASKTSDERENKGGHTDLSKSTYCNGSEEQKSIRSSGQEFVEQCAYSNGRLNVGTVMTCNSDHLEAVRHFQERKFCGLASKSYSSIVTRRKYSSQACYPIYNSRVNPVSTNLDEMLYRPNKSQDVASLIADRNLEASYASYCEYIAVDEWIRSDV